MVDTAAKLQMKLLESNFRFSKRMRNFFDALELATVYDLAQIPLEKLNFCRGFKEKCKQELICFIEAESLEDAFEGFQDWK